MCDAWGDSKPWWERVEVEALESQHQQLAKALGGVAQKINWGGQTGKPRLNKYLKTRKKFVLRFVPKHDPWRLDRVAMGLKMTLKNLLI